MSIYINTHDISSGKYNGFGSQILCSVSENLKLGTDLTSMIVSFSSSGVTLTTRDLASKILGVVTCYRTNNTGYVDRSSVWVGTEGLTFVKVDNPSDYNTTSSGAWITPSFTYPGYGHITPFNSYTDGWVVGRLIDQGRKNGEVLMDVKISMIGIFDTSITCPSESYSCNEVGSCMTYDASCPAANICVADCSGHSIDCTEYVYECNDQDPDCPTFITEINCDTQTSSCMNNCAELNPDTCPNYTGGTPVCGTQESELSCDSDSSSSECSSDTTCAEDTTTDAGSSSGEDEGD